MATVNDGPGTGRLTADWAVLGKHPGQVMGYDIVGGSLPHDLAADYLWGATTGTPEDPDPAAALPWRVFLGAVDKQPTPVCATVETTWDGSRDGTGAPSYAWRLLLLGWGQAAAARLTWSALNGVLPREATAEDGVRAALPVPRPPTDRLSAQVDELGFEWAARVAALLLDNRRVAITAAPGTALPDITGRVGILDAVCALLPYGCRAWLSAATWTGQSDHRLRLAFAFAAANGQEEARLGAAGPPDPQGGVARAYLDELNRLRAKGRSTADLVEHLLGCTAPLPVNDSAAALRALREVDLLDSVVESIRQGREDVYEIQRALEKYPADTWGEHRLAVLLPYLARRAVDSGPCMALLRQHWTPAVPRLLAEDVVAVGSTKESFERARGYLKAMKALATQCPDAFEELLAAVLSSPYPAAEWSGSLIHLVERTFHRVATPADDFLIAHRGASLAWLKRWLEDESRDRASLVRLVTRARDTAPGNLVGWLRFAAVLTAVLPPEQATEEDAAEFAEAHDGAWETALRLATDQGRPEVLSLLWLSLQSVVGDPEGRRQLFYALDLLAPPHGTGLTPAVAADADLLRALLADASDGPVPRSMPRARSMTDDTARDAYAEALLRRLTLDPALERVAVEALLGEEPDDAGWAMLCLLAQQRPTMEPLVEEGLRRRLTEDVRWLRLPLPRETVTRLSLRYGLGWAPPVWEFHTAARDPRPYDRLADVIASTQPSGSYSPQLLAVIVDWIEERGPAAAFRLAEALSRARPDRHLDEALWAAFTRQPQTHALVQRLVQFHLKQELRHQRLARALGADHPPSPDHQPFAAQPAPATVPSYSAPPPPALDRHKHKGDSFWARHRPIWWNGLR